MDASNKALEIDPNFEKVIALHKKPLESGNNPEKKIYLAIGNDRRFRKKLKI